MKYVRLLSVCMMVLSFTFTTTLQAQDDTKMQFIPATKDYSAGLNVYSTSTGEMKQYFVMDNKWVQNDYVPSPKISIKGKDYRMQFMAGNQSDLPGLFVYSSKTGEFEFFYLKEGEWMPNEFLPASKIAAAKGNTILEFNPASEQHDAFISFHSLNGNEFDLYSTDGEKWFRNFNFPKWKK